MLRDWLIFLFGNHDHSYIDRDAFWTAFVGLLAIGVAYFQLSSIRRTSRADFVQRFVKEFFGKETRDFFTLLMNSAFEFKIKPILDGEDNEIDRLPYFEIKKGVFNQIQDIVLIDKSRIGYNAFEIDDLLLGCFEDVGWYEKRGLVDVATVYQTFGYYIIETWKNEEISKYLGHEDNEGRYKDFEYIKNRCITYEYLKKTCPFFWFLILPIWKIFWYLRKKFLI